MRPQETVTQLSSFDRRGAGSDAERRAAGWLADQIEAGGRRTRIEPFWYRPNWALAQAWHVALALAGSLVAVSTPRVGGVLILIALVSIVVDELFGTSLGRRLTPERASQNVIGEPRSSGHPDPVRLIITANYDAGRMGLVYRDRLRRPAAAWQRAWGRRGPGWLGWLALALVWLLVVAILRLEGDRGTIIGAFQLVPTVALVLALALLLEIAGSDFGPAAGDNGTGTAVALALIAALDVGSPRHLEVELVLQGAGDHSAIGLRRYLRARKGQRRATNTIVLGIAASGRGTPRWWRSDGALFPMRYFATLQTLAAQVAGDLPEPATPHRGRGCTPALPARAARLPAIAIGCLDELGLAPDSHTPADQPETVDAAVTDATLQFGLMLVDAIDAYLAERATQAAPIPVTPA